MTGHGSPPTSLTQLMSSWPPAPLPAPPPPPPPKEAEEGVEPKADLGRSPATGRGPRRAAPSCWTDSWILRHSWPSSGSSLIPVSGRHQASWRAATPSCVRPVLPHTAHLSQPLLEPRPRGEGVLSQGGGGEHWGWSRCLHRWGCLSFLWDLMVQNRAKAPGQWGGTSPEETGKNSQGLGGRVRLPFCPAGPKVLILRPYGWLCSSCDCSSKIQV